MASSTVNTFREMGGILSVAILGAIVNSRLTGNLEAKLQSLGLPDTIQSLVIHAVTHGGNVPGGKGGAHSSQIQHHSQLVHQVKGAAYTAFGNGLDISLYVAGAILLVSAVIAWFTMRHGISRES
jgi:hypothetical protein